MMKTPMAYLGLVLAILVHSVAFGQTAGKQIHQREQLWFGYFNQTRFSNKWGIWTDVHYRMTDNFSERSFQFLFRPAVIYFIKDNLRLNVGYAYVHHFPAKGMNTSRNEHRPWQQIWWNQKYVGLTTLQWLRLEQRFNEKVFDDRKDEGYNYNFRARYSFAFLIPLKGKEITPRIPFAVIINEVFVNLGGRIVYNTFDQNRLFAGLGYPFTTHLNVHLGYMNVYQQEPSGNSYLSTHAIRLFVFHSLDLRSND